MNEREFAISVVKKLQDAGHQALWAGGCVRDELLGLVPKDYDVATDARPEQVRNLFPRTVAVGESFGVVEVMSKPQGGVRHRVQVATFHSDVSYSDGRHPDAVVFSTPEEDALRRDFTINGMFKDPLSGELVDYVGGQVDLKAGLLRAIGDPRERFREDRLRMLRAVRMAARFDMTLDLATEQGIRTMAAEITAVSAERIADELRKMLVHLRRARAMRMFLDVGLAAPVLPELLPMKGLPQGLPVAPTGDLWEHVLRVLDLLGEEVSVPLAFAALLHDVGKPRTVGRTPERYTFHGHEHVGRRLASDICVRLRMSNEERERIEWLVDKHQFLCEARGMKTSKLKTTLAHPGIRELLALHRADAVASGKDASHVDYCEMLLREWSEADLNPPAIITGHDLMKMGLAPGPLYKELLDAVREAQLDGTIRSSKQAYDLVGRLLQERNYRQGPDGKWQMPDAV